MNRIGTSCAGVQQDTILINRPHSPDDACAPVGLHDRSRTGKDMVLPFGSW